MKYFLVLFVVVLIVFALLFFQPGSFLVVDNPDKSDAILVLAGAASDNRYLHGLELLRAGYGRHLVLDTTTGVIYGHGLIDLAREFVARTAGPNLAEVNVCPVEGDSTKDEAPQAGQCLQKLQPPPHSVLIVTDDYHTRRALSIFRKRLPQYHWSTAPTPNPFLFGQPWWKNREWAKTYLTEWQKLLWWELYDRWQN